MDSSKQIKYGAVISYFAIFVNIAAMLVYTPWMKNQIGMANYGLFTLANSLISMFLLDFGIGSSVARFAAKYRAEKNYDAINRLMGLVYKIFCGIDLIIFIILFVLYFFIEKIYLGLTQAELEQFKTLYLIIAVYSIVSFPFTTLSGLFNAYERFVPLKLCDLGQKLLSIALIVLVLCLNMGVTTMVLVNALSGIISIVVKLIYINKKTSVRADFKVHDRKMLKDIFSFSVWVMILGIAQRLTYNIAPSILGVFSTSHDIAIYSPASSIAGYFYTFATAINGLFLPTISNKIAEKKDDDILPLMISVGRFQVVVLGLLFVGFVSIGKSFMVLWMGEEFLPAYYCTIILALPTIFEYSQQIARTTILAKNKVNYQAIGLIVTSLINIAMAAVITPRMGAKGVCIAIMITSFLNFIYMNIVFYKVLKINVFKFFKETYIPILIPIVFSLIVVTASERIVPSEYTWISLIVRGVLTTIVFLSLAYLFCLKKEERKMICQKIFKRGGKHE